jgi:hypothetical protein
MLSLTRCERDVLNVVITWSVHRGREWAIFPGTDVLSKFCGIKRQSAERTLAALCCDEKASGEKTKKTKLLERSGKRGQLRLRFCAPGIMLDPPTQVDPHDLAGIVSEMERINAMPDGFEPGGQKLLGLQTPEEKLGADQVKRNRERNVEMLREARLKIRGGNVPDPAPMQHFVAFEGEAGGSESNGMLPTQRNVAQPESAECNKMLHKQQDVAQPGAAEKPAAYIRARAPASDHVPPKSMYHVSEHGAEHEHARRVEDEGAEKFRGFSPDELESMLDEESSYALGELLAITGPMSASYHRTWLMRLNDRWKVCALKAIGEIKREKIRGGKPKKTWGHWANFLFLQSKAEAQRRASSHHATK